MQMAQLSRLIAMAATVKRSLAGGVEARVKSGKCLVCDSVAERRGLCFRHYHTFLRRQREHGTRDDQAAFEEACIREGKILAVHQMRALKRDDPFDV